MLVYVSFDDRLRTELVTIHEGSPSFEKDLAIELPDELVVRYQKAEYEHAEVQGELTRELRLRRA